MLNEIPLQLLNDVHWKVQDSTSSSLLFYKIGEDQKSESQFLERIKSAAFGWLVVNRSIQGLPKNSSVISEQDWPNLQATLMDQFYPMPDLKLIAITGTNGKTTTTDLVLQLAHLVGKKGVSVGTLGVREYQKTILDFGLTSPSYIDLRKFLNLYGKDKDFCVLEASSHALDQHRLHGLTFEAAGWTSFSQDHLDYHVTMQNYFEAKAKLFSKLKPEASLFVPRTQKELIKLLEKYEPQLQIASEIPGKLPLFFSTKFNRDNLEVALAIVQNVFKLNHDFDFNQLQPPDGRFYIQSFRSNFIVVDFAHTPDALENICQGIRDTFPQHRLKVLFGCGGDRDRTKRPKMGAVVAQFADEIYVTSDNPRTENPDQIIQDIVQGMQGKKFKTITERPLAVKTAFSELEENEILLLAGKGHEDYILIHGVKHPYSDIKEVDEFIARNKS